MPYRLQLQNVFHEHAAASYTLQRLLPRLPAAIDISRRVNATQNFEYDTIEAALHVALERSTTPIAGKIYIWTTAISLLMEVTVLNNAAVLSEKSMGRQERAIPLKHMFGLLLHRMLVVVSNHAAVPSEEYIGLARTRLI